VSLLFQHVAGFRRGDQRVLVGLQKEAIRRRLAGGGRHGRRPSLSPTQRAHAREMREAGKSLQEIGDVLGVSHMTVWRITDRASQIIGQ
jgi:DNA invertase Pin-like site-specific DNA recombinase